MIFLAKAQDDCEKFRRQEKVQTFYLKLISSRTYLYSNSSNQNFGCEAIYNLDLVKNHKFSFSIGLGYFYRELVDAKSGAGFYITDVSTFNLTKFKLNHNTFEIPLNLNYCINPKSKRTYNLFLGTSFVYLFNGRLTFTAPKINSAVPNLNIPGQTHTYNYKFGNIDNMETNNYINQKMFFPTVNQKITLGFFMHAFKRFNVGFEFNRFIKSIGSINCDAECSNKIKENPTYNNFSIFTLLKI